MRFGVLGPLAVWTADGREVRVPEAKVRMLLARLVVAEGRPVTVDRLADDLWGDRLPGNPGNTLQTKVSQLRKALKNAELVSFQAGGYVLDGDVDVTRFRELTARARVAEQPRIRAELLTEALALWRGPALADFADEPFAVPVIQRLTEERLAATEEWAEARLDLGEHRELVGELNELVAAYPLRERLRALQLRALYRSGRQTEALESYRHLHTVLADELGLAPSQELVDLHQAILAQDPALGGGIQRSRLPEPLTELVGRDLAVRSVLAVIDESRLVTLTGPGGVGKTRLAIQIARQAPAALLVEFSGDDLVAEVTAAALGIRDEAGSLPERLANFLRAKEMLLVLDNCERLVEPVAQLAARLLAAAPGLRILATSQEPLGVAGEVLWNVPPLDVPGAASVAVRDVRAFSAVQLFVARAAAAAPGFVLTDDNASAVAAICRRLDGIPLALELAATRLRALGPDELLSRLDDRFRLLASGNRGGPARQRTLRAMIDWSWDTLSDVEQKVLRRLAVHVDGFGLAAAEAVSAGDEGDVVIQLSTLVDRSLVASGPGPRYRLLESVAAYGVERLVAAGEYEQLRRRHAEYYVTLAELADVRLRTNEQRDWLDRLDVEAANLRRALETAVQQTDAGLALRLVKALAWYWFLRGRLNEARRAIRQALNLPGEVPDLRAVASAWDAGLAILAGEPVAKADLVVTVKEPHARATAMWFLGHVTTTMGGVPTTEDLTVQALAEFEALDDSWGTAVALLDRVIQHRVKGDFTAGQRDSERAVELINERGERWSMLQATFVTGTLAQIAGDYETAERVHREGLRMAEELDLAPEISYKLSWLGRLAMMTDDYPRAWELHERARRIGAEQGFRPAEMYAETGLGLGARRTGQLDLAEKHLRNVLDWHRDQGFESGSALILAELGFVAEHRGEAEAAMRWQLAGYEIARDLGDPRAVALALEGLAGAHALAGTHVQAARLLGAAAQARESVGHPLPPGQQTDIARITNAATKALGPTAFEAEFKRGSQTPPSDLVSPDTH